MSQWTDKRVLVTGGAGFIGHVLVQKLVDLGAKVTVVDDLSKGNLENLHETVRRIELRKSDLLDERLTQDLLSDKDVCFHLAAKIGGIGYFHKTPASSLRENCLMNLNLWNSAVNAECKMVCSSSSMVFERTNEFPTPETAVYTSPPPITGYGFSKLAAEYIARTYHEEYGVDFLIVRPFNAYGPGEGPGSYVGYAHVIPDLIHKALSGQFPLKLLGDGQQTRSYTYVDDIADAIIYLSERFRNEDFNIGTGIETTVVDLARKIWSLCARVEPFETEATAGFEHDVLRRVPDVSKIFETGWRPNWTLEDGLNTTIKWLRGRMELQ